jgi:hypothetical protein
MKYLCCNSTIFYQQDKKNANFVAICILRSEAGNPPSNIRSQEKEQSRRKQK